MDNAALGLATTRELLEEVRTRAMISRLDETFQPHWDALRQIEVATEQILAAAPDRVLDYRTVRS